MVPTAASVALGLVLAALLVLTVAFAGPEDEPGRARAAEADAPPVATAAARDEPADDPRTDASAPRSRPVELVQVLADERAAAWREADPGRLQRADATGSPAAARDAAALAQLVRAGVRYTGLRHTVVSAEAVPRPGAASRPSPPTRAVVRARIDAGAYTVEDSTRVLESRAAVTGVPVLLHLLLTDEGWRIDDVEVEP